MCIRVGEPSYSRKYIYIYIYHYSEINALKLTGKQCF